VAGDLAHESSSPGCETALTKKLCTSDIRVFLLSAHLRSTYAMTTSGVLTEIDISGS
jgi:hypothetical protein